jgi:hypothetical protein
MAGGSIERIARFHGRTEGAIWSRLERLDLAKYEGHGEYISKVDGIVRNEHGAMAVLDIRTQQSNLPKRNFELKGTETGRISGRKANLIIMDDVIEDKPEPKKLVAIPSPAMFENDKQYVLVHRNAVENFKKENDRQNRFVSEEYLDDLHELQDKFYEVKGALPMYTGYGKEASGIKYVLLSGMTIPDCCIQATYKTPKEGHFRFKGV